VLRVLVEKGHLDVNTSNFQQLTPLHVAVAQCHVDCAKQLLAYGCNVNVKVSVITSGTPGSGEGSGHGGEGGKEEQGGRSPCMY